MHYQISAPLINDIVLKVLQVPRKDGGHTASEAAAAAAAAGAAGGAAAATGSAPRAAGLRPLNISVSSSNEALCSDNTQGHTSPTASDKSNEHGTHRSNCHTHTHTHIYSPAPTLSHCVRRWPTVTGILRAGSESGTHPATVS